MQDTASPARCKQVDIVLGEIEAVRDAMTRANPGDLVVLCVDKHAEVMAEIETMSKRAQAGSRATGVDDGADPDFSPAAGSGTSGPAPTPDMEK